MSIEVSIFVWIILYGLSDLQMQHCMLCIAWKSRLIFNLEIFVPLVDKIVPNLWLLKSNMKESLMSNREIKKKFWHHTEGFLELLQAKL